ncbi:MAG: hypothetical protein VX897_04500, partial [Actinomycetota bacterium]|nr:hypothetical protein [Actinomycetota bacterium]
EEKLPALGEKALGAFPRPESARSSKTTVPGRIPDQNPFPDFERDYPSWQMPVITGETRGNERKNTSDSGVIISTAPSGSIA